MKKLLLITLAALACGCTGATRPAATETVSSPAPEIYEWRNYTLADAAQGADPALLDNFLRDHLIPAYGRQGVDVGVFAAAPEAAGAAAYPEYPFGARHLLITWPDLETFRRVSDAVRNDAGFNAGAAEFFAASAKNPVYTAQQTYLIEQMAAGPALKRPAPERGLLELRVYRSPNMEANERKIKMFEQGEIAVFDATGVNGVFYGRTLAGPRMPSLVYLTWYASPETRTEAWARFGQHPEWQRMRSLPEYANTATDNVSRLVTPMPYSKY